MGCVVDGQPVFAHQPRAGHRFAGLDGCAIFLAVAVLRHFSPGFVVFIGALHVFAGAEGIDGAVFAVAAGRWRAVADNVEHFPGV